MSTIKIANRDDILRWSDGTTCYRWEWERGDYAWMSDDFEVITTDSPEYEILQRDREAPRTHVRRRVVTPAPVQQVMGLPDWAEPPGAPPAGFVPNRLAACPSASLDTSEREAIDP